MHIVENLVSLFFTSISNSFTIIRWPTLATMVPMRTTTTPPPTLEQVLIMQAQMLQPMQQTMANMQQAQGH
jgi:hypothetical protein